MTSVTPPMDARRKALVRAHLESAVDGTWAGDRRPVVGRLATVGLGAAALTGLFALGLGSSGSQTNPLSPGVAAAGVSFSPGSGGTVLAEITDPAASAEQMTAAFRDQGYDITVSLAPATPLLVGSVVMTFTSDWKSGQIQGGPSRAGCKNVGGGTCPTSIRVPAGFSARGEVVIGRQPGPGEEVVTGEPS